MIATPRKITALKFGLLSPEHVRKISEARIVTADTYDEDGYPFDGGLMDPRLGVVDPGLKCKTCGSRVGECPGHFGHIELARPVIHIGYAKLVYKILRSICRACGRIKLSPEKIDEFAKKLSDARKLGQNVDDIVDTLFKTARTTKKCPHCEEELFEVKFDKPSGYIENKNRLSPTDVRERLEKIPDSDADIMGFDTEVSRPNYT
jgi:DNA-directed RNA polymerase subunit A'